jgi:hypothetical protein
MIKENYIFFIIFAVQKTRIMVRKPSSCSYQKLNRKGQDEATILNEFDGINV